MGEGEGVMFQENSIETCIFPYVKQTASPGSMHEIGRSGLVHWDDWYTGINLRDGMGGGWRGVQDGDKCTSMAD